jgi:midasin
MTVAKAVYHAIQLVIMDGLCLGIDVAGGRQKDQIVSHCRSYLAALLQRVFSLSDTEISILEAPSPPLTDTQKLIGVEPFFIDKKKETVNQGFAFDARTTKSNLFKLLRAYTLNKPILIEGPPGVGKTSLVENLARVSGRTLTRINLSEQTDMMDLLGSEYPTVSDSQQDDAEADNI